VAAIEPSSFVVGRGVPAATGAGTLAYMLPGPGPRARGSSVPSIALLSVKVSR